MKRNSSGQPTPNMFSAVVPALFRMQMLKNFWRDDRGQDLVEYALVVALISLGATASMSTVATSISSAFSSVGSKFGGYFS
jgi:pilus assembly protein Flp/PilA